MAQGIAVTGIAPAARVDGDASPTDIKNQNPFMLTPADAARVTVDPNDAYRLGTFPYFSENIIGMFLRVLLSRSPATSSMGDGIGDQQPTEDNCLWGRVVRVVTADSVDSDTALPSQWRNRIKRSPQYVWRGRRYEAYLIVEHPRAIILNGYGGGARDASAEGGSGIDDEQTPPPGMDTIAVPFSRLAKHYQPSESDIYDYCAQFNQNLMPRATTAPLTLMNADLSGPLGSSTGAAESSTQALDPLFPFEVPVGFRNTFLTMPPDPASSKKEDGLKTAAGPQTVSMSQLSNCCFAWQRWYTANVLHRTLTAEDATKIMHANSRLSNIMRNVVIRSTIEQHTLLEQKAKTETERLRQLRRSQGARDGSDDLPASSDGDRLILEGVPSSQEVSASSAFAAASPEGLNMSLVAAAGDGADETHSMSDQELLLYHLRNNSSLDHERLVALTQRNIRKNSELQLRGEYIYKKRRGDTAAMSLSTGMWVTDEHKREELVAAYDESKREKDKKKEDKKGGGKSAAPKISVAEQTEKCLKEAQTLRPSQRFMESSTAADDLDDLLSVAKSSVDSLSPRSSGDWSHSWNLGGKRSRDM